MVWLSLYSLLIAVVAVILVKMVSPNKESMSMSMSPPGNSGLPLIGETFSFMAAISSSQGFYDFVRIRRLRYGSCFKTRIFGETHVFISSKDSAKAILSNESGIFTKRYIKSIAQLIGEQSLLCASHQHHKLIRGRIQNLFSTTWLSVFVKQFDELVVKSLDAWEDQQTVIVLHHALQITLKAMCKMLMSIEGGEELKILEDDIASVYQAMLAFPLNLPWTRFHKGLKARKNIMAKLDTVIANRRSSKDEHKQDFLQHLLTPNEKDYKLTDAEIKDNILTMIIAGQDTTASAITWMVKYLGENQNVLNALSEEQFHIKQINSKSYLTLEDLGQMTFASKVVKESLRMASVVPWFPRLVLDNCEIQGFKIMKGWNANIDARSLHLDPILYQEPYNFNPSRFDDESKPYSFLAFGMGGRTCLGMNLAKSMMLVFLHRLVTTYKWEVADSDSSIEKWALFSRLKSGCPIRLTRITN
ncbi:abscisic acid 8'-hydroxylase 4 [Euphorbia lathyris]|uniref:abscisic acid 8'-hydroxylase 4 n=1 Tax=Euphorbia lathyris TaxID=212925 RepID=UPI0033135925